ncbi:hypothetical protein B0H11DRAFT_1800210 [Mycena galericulata]|nr:hypothetical protein B0H11DRAFT_1800210 [Mycena galericulata]
MHRCLTILEILEMICSNLDPCDRDLPGDVAVHVELVRPKQRALASLARTCTLFQGPALSLLWKTQVSLEPILRCMPSDLFHDVRHEGRLIRRLLRPIVETDFVRLYIYAPRVKNLLLGYRDIGVFSEILPVLNFCLPGGLLFPNLQVLRWRQSVSQLAYMKPLFPPKPTSISLTYDASNGNLSLLSTLATACPGLTHVFLSPRPDQTQEERNRVASLFIRGLHHIESLTMGTLDMATFEHLARLPRLTSLRLARFPGGFLSSPTPSYRMFPHLRNLAMGSVHVELATKFLRMCPRTSFTSLEVDFSAPCLVAQTVEFYTALKASCLHSSLTSLALNNYSEIPAAGRKEFLVTGRSLHILGCFINLRELTIRSFPGFDLDDTLVTELAPAWRNLLSLELQTSVLPVPSRLTLESLRSLAQHCPHLHTLTVDFNATSLPPRSSDPRLAQESLKTLHVESSPISGWSRVARFLSGLFSDLESITTDREDEDNESPEELEDHGEEIERHRLWKEVESHIGEFVLARQEEQELARASFGL